MDEYGKRRKKIGHDDEKRNRDRKNESTGLLYRITQPPQHPAPPSS